MDPGRVVLQLQSQQTAEKARGDLIITCLRKLRLLLRRSIKRENAELTFLLQAIIGERLIGVSQDKDGTIQLRFDDWVVFVRNPFPSPIIERIPCETGGSR